VDGPVLDVQIGDLGVVHLLQDDEMVGLSDAAIGP
jgi:hypothetical protein